MKQPVLIPARPTIEKCGATCPRNRYVNCEFPVTHEVGFNAPADYHLGRDRHGKWWSWREAEGSGT